MDSEARILVLGASGYLGPHLVAALAPLGTVLVASRRPEEAPRPGSIGPAGTRHWDALASRSTLEALLDDVRPRLVVLAAALARVANCEREPERAQRMNVDVPGAVARACRERGARAVLISTDLVFGARPPASGERYGEEDPPAPVHAYGRTKASGERHFLAEHAEGLVVRLPLLYGDSGGRGAGASDQVLAAVARGERPALFEDEWRTPLEVGNAARAVAELAEGPQSGILHLAGPQRLSRVDLGLLVLEAHGFSGREGAERVRVARRADLGLAGRPADVSLDASRARRLLRTPLLAPRSALGLATA